MPLENALGHAPLLLALQDRADINYLEALAEGAPEAAVFILDLGDPYAAEIGAQAAGADLESILAEAEGRGVRPLVAWGVPRELAVELLVRFPDVARLVTVPNGDDCYWIVTVAGGSASAALRHLPRRRDADAPNPVAEP